MRPAERDVRAVGRDRIDGQQITAAGILGFRTGQQTTWFGLTPLLPKLTSAGVQDPGNPGLKKPSVPLAMHCQDGASVMKSPLALTRMSSSVA